MKDTVILRLHWHNCSWPAWHGSENRAEQPCWPLFTLLERKRAKSNYDTHYEAETSSKCIT